MDVPQPHVSVFRSLRDFSEEFSLSGYSDDVAYRVGLHKEGAPRDVSILDFGDLNALESDFIWLEGRAMALVKAMESGVGVEQALKELRFCLRLEGW